MAFAHDILPDIVDWVSAEGLAHLKPVANSTLAPLLFRRANKIYRRLENHIAELRNQWSRMAKLVFDRNYAYLTVYDESPDWLVKLWKAWTLEALPNALTIFSTQLEAIAILKEVNHAHYATVRPNDKGDTWHQADLAELDDGGEKIFTFTLKEDSGLSPTGKIVATEAQWELVKHIKTLKVKKDALLLGVGSSSAV